MAYSAQCCFCGEIITMAAPVIFCGWYPCPVCKEIALRVPETALTPNSKDPFLVIDFAELNLTQEG